MKTLALAAAVFAGASSLAFAEPTRVMVRAHSGDAKFIGDLTGGVDVTLSEATSGKVLARGRIAGGTGDTERIIRKPRVRGERITDDKTAGFEATIDLERPTLVTAIARGPLGKPAAAITVSSSLWILPGRHITGDGWVLEFPGLAVEPTTTPGGPGELKVAAKVGLMCGCPIEPGGLWASENYAIEASLLSGGRTVATAPLAYAGTASQFAGSLKAAPGRYTLRVTAADAKTPNAGVSEIPVEVR